LITYPKRYRANSKELTKKELDEEYIEPDSNLDQWSSKKKIKKEIINGRKQKDQLIKVSRLLEND